MAARKPTRINRPITWVIGDDDHRVHLMTKTAKVWSDRGTYYYDGEWAWGVLLEAALLKGMDIRGWIPLYAMAVGSAEISVLIDDATMWEHDPHRIKEVARLQEFIEEHMKPLLEEGIDY